MIKRKGRRRERETPHLVGKMTDAESTAYSEALGAINGDYQTLCLISDKLREVEATSRTLGSLDSQAQTAHMELSESNGNGARNPWEVCASLMRLDNNEVFLCQRAAEHGVEYAVIDHLPAASAYAKAHGPLDILRTGDNPRQVLREYLLNERQTLELMANDISASVRVFMADRFPTQDLSRVVNALTRMCKKVAHFGFSEALTDLGPDQPKQGRGVRI